MKKAIIFLFLVFSFVSASLLCGNNGFDTDIDAQTILSFVKKNKISAKQFTKKLDLYPLQNPNIQDENGRTILHHLISTSGNNGYLDAFLEKYIDRIDAKTALYSLRNYHNLACKEEYKNRMISIASEWKKFIFTDFCYGLMFPFLKIDDPKKIKVFMVPIALTNIGLSMYSIVWTGYKRDRAIDGFSDSCTGKNHFLVSAGSFAAGFVLRIILANKFQKKCDLINTFIQRNPQRAVFLENLLSLASTIYLHKIRSTPEGEQ